MRPPKLNAILTNLLVLYFMSGATLAQDANTRVQEKSDGTSVAADGGIQPADELLAVQRNLRLMYPKTRFGNITPTPLPGIYEVVMGRNVAFVEGAGRFFIFGRMFDMEKQQDITSVSPTTGTTSPKVDFSSLPLDQAIKTVRGTGRRVLAVFSDPDCPYCKKLEQDLSTVDDVTIYTFLMPLEQMHPEARVKSNAVWCSTDRSAAWSALMLDGKAPKNVKNCEAPYSVVLPLAEKLNINGTPYLIAGDGRTLAGAVSAARLTAWLDDAAKSILSNAPVTGQTGSGK